MSRASMTAAAATLPRTALWGIGNFQLDSGGTNFDIGWVEFERDADWAHSMLRSAGLRSGDLVLITSPNVEGPWVTPIVHGLRRIGVTYACAEIFGWDARRASMFLQRLPVRAIFGLGGETVVALQDQEAPIGELLRNVEFVWARADALAMLSEVEPEVLPFVPLGPALALGHPGNSGAVVNGDEWVVETDHAELLVTNTRERATTFHRQPTGVQGAVRSVADSTVILDLASD